VRRNGLPRSDEAMLTEHWMLHGDVLTVATIVYDPVYLTEPFIRTTDYELDLHQQNPRTRARLWRKSTGRRAPCRTGSGRYRRPVHHRFREALRHSRRSREGRRRDDVSGIPIEAPGHACDVRGGAAVSENPYVVSAFKRTLPSG